MSRRTRFDWLVSRVYPRRQSARRDRATFPYSRRLRIEALEERQLLSISWTNKGVSSGDDNDRFDLAFGSLAGQARGVVDAAIDFWERSINSFNYGDGGNDVYELKVQMNEFPLPAGSGVGANGGFGNTRNNKPSKGSMGIGWRLDVAPGANSAAGYFLDPTPYESSEFQGTWQNGFTRQNTANLGGADLFTLVLHELGHAMGLASTPQTDAFSLDTEYVDNVNTPASNPFSTLWLFDNGSLWTEWDSGGATGTPTNAAGAQHFAPLGTSAVRLGVTYSGAVALMNASFTSRSIISNLEMDAARLAYGYTVTPPSTYGTTYGQLDANGTLRIDTSSLGNSADAITLSVSGSVLSLTIDTGAPVAGIDPTGSFTSIFAASSVFRVQIDAGGGGDVITIGGLGAAPITVGGGDGNDSLIINGATGNNTLGAASYSGGSHNITSYSSIENVTLNGTAGNENFNVSRATLIGPDTVVVNGFDGADNVVLGSGDLQFSAPYSYFLFNGGGGADDGIALNNATQNTLNWQYGIYATFADAFAAGYYLQANYAGVENVTIQGSMRKDQFIPDSNSGVTAKLFGNDGDDNFIVGGGNVGFLPAWILNGGNGNDAITLDNRLATINHTVEFQPNQVVFYGGVFTISTVGFETVGWLGGSGNDQVRMSGTMTQGLNVDAGLGNDTIVVGYSSAAQFFGINTINGGDGNDGFTWRASNNVINDGFAINTYEVALDGGGGFNSLTVDDATRGLTVYDIYPDRIKAKDALSSAWADFGYDNMNSLGIIASGSANSAKVFGVSSDIPAGQQMTLLMNGGTDNVTIYPRDVNGDLTINGNLGIGGGSGTDTLTVNDTASVLPINYLFQNLFGAGTTNIAGMGAAGFGAGSDVETISVLGGTGDDVFGIDSFKSGSGLYLSGGGGADTLDVTPTGMTIQSNVTNAAAFSFDGGEGSDAFNLHNANSTLPFTYNATATSLQATASGYGSFTFSHSNVESVSVEGGTNADVFNAKTVALGQTLSLNGGGNSDSYFVSNAMSTNGIAGGVYVYDGVGTDSVSIDDRADTTGKTLHVGQGFVGAVAGDNLFAAGGFLYYANVAGALTIKLGSGSETVYAVPDSTTPIFIEANNPTVAAQGDWLGLAFANAQNPVFTAGVPGEGAYSFDNAAFFYYSGFESTVIDDVAPYIVAQSYDDTGLVPTIVVQFSEDVSNALSVYYLELINTTTSEQVPFAYLDLAYDAGTNTASFTFPGYPDGILPAGDYSAIIYATLADFFGNPMGGEPPQLLFTVTATPPALPGDYNLNGEVDAADYTVWRDALGQTGLTPFSGADGSGNGIVGTEDYDVWTAHFGETAPGSGGSMEQGALALTQGERGEGGPHPLDSSRPLSATADLRPEGEARFAALADFGELDFANANVAGVVDERVLERLGYVSGGTPFGLLARAAVDARQDAAAMFARAGRDDGLLARQAVDARQDAAAMYARAGRDDGLLARQAVDARQDAAAMFARAGRDDVTVDSAGGGLMSSAVLDCFDAVFRLVGEER